MSKELKKEAEKMLSKISGDEDLASLMTTALYRDLTEQSVESFEATFNRKPTMEELVVYIGQLVLFLGGYPCIEVWGPKKVSPERDKYLSELESETGHDPNGGYVPWDVTRRTK